MGNTNPVFNTTVRYWFSETSEKLFKDLKAKGFVADDCGRSYIDANVPILGKKYNDNKIKSSDNYSWLPGYKLEDAADKKRFSAIDIDGDGELSISEVVKEQIKIETGYDVEVPEDMNKEQLENLVIQKRKEKEAEILQNFQKLADENKDLLEYKDYQDYYESSTNSKAWKYGGIFTAVGVGAASLVTSGIAVPVFGVLSGIAGINCGGQLGDKTVSDREESIKSKYVELDKALKKFPSDGLKDELKKLKDDNWFLQNIYY